MLVNTLKSNQPYVIILIILTGVSLWVVSIIEPVGMPIPSDGFYNPLYQKLSELFPIRTLGSVIFAMVFVLLQAFLLVQFNKKYILINYRTYLPAFFYVLIASSFIFLQRINPAIIGTVFIFISLNYLFSIYRTDYALNKVYIAAFFVSIASLFWAPLSIFILMVWISLLVLRPFIGREWIVSLLGFITPLFFVFVYYYIAATDYQLNLLISSFQKSFTIKVELNSLHYSYYIFYGLLLVIVLVSSYTMVANFQKKKIKNRKYFVIYWWLFALSILLIAFFKYVSYEIIYIASIPVSFLLTDYFYNIRLPWYLNILLAFLFASLIYIQIAAH